MRRPFSRSLNSSSERKALRPFDEQRLRSLRTTVIWTGIAAVVGMTIGAVVVSFMGWQTFGPRILTVLALSLLTAVSVRVVQTVRYTPPATMFLLCGGLLLIASQVLTMVGTLRLWQDIAVIGSENFGLSELRAMTGWGGFALLLTGFYISLVDGAIGYARLQREGEQLRIEITLREEAEAKLRAAHDVLEDRVRERTAELLLANEQLQLTADSLRRSEQRFEHVAMSTGEWIFELDSNGHYVWSSRAVEDLLGYSATEVVGRRYEEFFAESEVPPDTEHRHLEQLTARFDLREWKRTVDGEERLHHTVGVQLTNAEGQVTGYLGVSRDITAQRQLEEHIVQVQRIEAVAQLASGVAHDFSNLLKIIVGCAEGLKPHIASESAAQSNLRDLIQAAEQGQAISRSLLALGAPGREQPKPFVVNTCLQETARLVRRLLTARVSLALDVPDTPLWVHGDPIQLQQATINLAINARDAMPHGGTVRVRLTQEDEEWVTIRVSDQGIGMSQEVQARMFDPFFTTKPRGLGTGLGLAIVSSVVRAHEGEIQCESTPGQGTTFTIRLPRCRNLPTDRPTPAAAPVGQGECIVLAVNNPFVMALMKNGLRQAAYQVQSVQNVGELLALCKQRDHAPIGVIIIDEMLADGSGMEALRQLRNNGIPIPVLLTATPGDGASVASDSRACILNKPFGTQAIAAAVAALIDPSRQELKT
jgi:PAS domain S-box-containing protein